MPIGRTPSSSLRSDRAARGAHVLVLTSTLPRAPGDGTPRFVLDLALRLADGFETTILAPHAFGVPQREEIGRVQIRRFRYLPDAWERLAYGGGITENLETNRWLYLSVLPFLLAQVLSIRRLLRRERVDVIHAHWWLPQAFSAVIARYLAGKPSVPVVCTLHGTDVSAFESGVMSRVMSWVLLRCRIVCPVSLALCESLPRQVLQRSDVRVAPMGVDMAETFRPAEGVKRNDNEVIFVGRLATGKGVEWLIRAFAYARGRAPDSGICLRIVGDGALRLACEALVRELAVVDHICFEGAVGHDRLPRLLSGASVAVVPSLGSEGLGLAAIEAQACRCAVIVSDTPSLAGLVVHERTGLIVRRGDVEALGGALLRLVEDKDLCASLAEAGRASALRAYDWALSARRYAEIYKEAVRGAAVATET